MLIAGFSAYSRDLDYAKFREIADEVGATLWADIAHPAGLVAKGLLNSPFEHCHVVTTTTHKTLHQERRNDHDGQRFRKYLWSQNTKRRNQNDECRIRWSSIPRNSR